MRDYDDPLDSDGIDPDPSFRETLRLLNGAGVHTVSSCQGHAPGTQYEDVREWMDAYVTAEAPSVEDQAKAAELLKRAGATIVVARDGKVLGKFRREWDWAESVAALRPGSAALRPVREGGGRQ